MAQARQLMHDIDTGKVSGQAAFERLLGLHAANEVGTLAFMNKAREGEIAKLGATGPDRVRAIETFIDARLPEELAAPVKTMLVSEKIVKGFEKLMADFRGAGVGSPAPSRAPDEPARLSQDQYEKLSFSEKMDYANRFPQPAGANGAAR